MNNLTEDKKKEDNKEGRIRKERRRNNMTF